MPNGRDEIQCFNCKYWSDEHDSNDWDNERGCRKHDFVLPSIWACGNFFICRDFKPSKRLLETTRQFGLKKADTRSLEKDTLYLAAGHKDGRNAWGLLRPFDSLNSLLFDMWATMDQEYGWALLLERERTHFFPQQGEKVTIILDSRKHEFVVSQEARAVWAGGHRKPDGSWYQSRASEYFVVLHCPQEPHALGEWLSRQFDLDRLFSSYDPPQPENQGLTSDGLHVLVRMTQKHKAYEMIPLVSHYLDFSRNAEQQLVTTSFWEEYFEKTGTKAILLRPKS
jgi:hypothetical protein